MSTLYRSVLIESAEQAEALPEGTVIIHAEYYPQEKFDGLWGREGNSSASLAAEEGWSALVPIEAEEETGCDVHDPPCIGCRPLWDDKEE